MKTTVYRAVQALALVLAPLAASCLSGCHIIADRGQIDLKKIANIPQAIGDGFWRDLQRYERVRHP